MYSALFILNTTSKASNPPLLRVCVHGVCVHFRRVKCTNSECVTSLTHTQISIREQFHKSVDRRGNFTGDLHNKMLTIKNTDADR